jgi:hypothetical protein
VKSFKFEGIKLGGLPEKSHLDAILNGLVHLSIWTKPFINFRKKSKIIIQNIDFTVNTETYALDLHWSHG